MDQIKKLFFSLSLAQRISLGVALLAIVGGVLAFSHWNTERDFKPLYTGLSQEDSSAVLSKVKEGGMEYRLSENGSAVLVPSARVAEMRLQLAAAGVPKTGRIGYELFDKTNFGTSDFAEQVNYRRALEGELERTLMGLAEVEQARVHLTLPKESVFTETRQPAKASVMLTLKQGAHLAPANVNAVTQLMASAVEGLTPEGVSVVDKLGNLLSRQKKPGADNPEADDAMLEYRAKVEREYLAKVNTTLAPYVGTDHFTACVAECELNSGEQSEETFDPEKSVMTTAQKTEEISGANGASGIPGTPTNLPRPTIRAGGGVDVGDPADREPCLPDQPSGSADAAPERVGEKALGLGFTRQPFAVRGRRAEGEADPGAAFSRNDEKGARPGGGSGGVSGGSGRRDRGGKPAVREHSKHSAAAVAAVGRSERAGRARLDASVVGERNEEQGAGDRRRGGGRSRVPGCRGVDLPEAA